MVISDRPGHVYWYETYVTLLFICYEDEILECVRITFDDGRTIEEAQE
jgi:hypothetical protein